MELEQLENMLHEIKPELKNRFGVKKIGFFGSYAQKTNDSKSDVDLLVEIERPMGLIKFITIQQYLSDRLKKSVDLLTFDSIKPHMRHEILKNLRYV